MKLAGECLINTNQPAHLPPLDAWKVNPDKLTRFYAPTDDRGFVLPDATVETILELFHDDYQWPIDPKVQQLRPDIHHFHWYARLYQPDLHGGSLVAQKFRELPTNKGLMPRQFHNVIHEVTLPPNVPKQQHMKQYLGAYASARILLANAERLQKAHGEISDSLIIRDDGETIADKFLIDQFARQFRGYQMNLENILENGSLRELRLDDPYLQKRAPAVVAKRLGAAAVGNVRNFVPRFSRSVKQSSRAA